MKRMMTAVACVLALASIALLGSASPAAAQGFGSPQTPMPCLFRILQMKSVQEELKLEPLQLQRIAIIRTEAQKGTLRVARTVTNVDPKKKPAGGQPAVSVSSSGSPDLDKTIEYLTAAEQRIYAILKPEQATRLHQLEMQADGPRAILKKPVRDALKFQALQEQALGNLLATERAAIQRAATSPNPAQALAAVRADADRRLLGMLTTGQRAQYEAMRGKKFAEDLTSPY